MSKNPETAGKGITSQNPDKGQTNQQLQGDNPALRKDENKLDRAEGGTDRAEGQGGQGQGAGWGRNIH